jgi:hypothetical protein
MIKHTDIRIGNLLYYDEDIVEVDGIHYSGKSLYTKPSESCISHNWKDIERFRPIPITQEILDKSSLYGRKDFLWKYDGGVVIREEGYYIALKDVSGVLFKSFKQIKYLHELQNWIYLIDGCELDLKLSYEERIKWFIQNYYESGMELSILLETMKDTDLDNFEFNNERIYIPKFKIEI